ncbi:MAG TPA: carboxypeptidase-like regulatory domain-containing protein [Sphingomicrobium sp.]|nr:carboxypeptidase-like regulatory domain-containing protein [Sphingomicrobium sp.]
MKDLRVSFPKPCREKWDAMRPSGCNRFCARCDTVIHDLAEMSPRDVEALVQSKAEICVRAQVGPDGHVKLRPGGRRMVAAIGASVGILAASSQAAASETPKFGAIKGEVMGSCGGLIVTATAADGRIYRAKVGPNGRYKVKRLPAGDYDVKTEVGGPEPPKASHVVVQAGRTTKLDINDPLNFCIVVGMLRIDDSIG